MFRRSFDPSLYGSTPSIYRASPQMVLVFSRSVYDIPADCICISGTFCSVNRRCPTGFLHRRPEHYLLSKSLSEKRPNTPKKGKLLDVSTRAQIPSMLFPPSSQNNAQLVSPSVATWIRQRLRFATQSSSAEAILARKPIQTDTQSLWL